MAEVTWELPCLPGTIGESGFPAKNFPKEPVFCVFRVNHIPSILFYSAIGSRMNGMIFHSSRKRNSSQKNRNTIYSRIVPKERTLSFQNVQKFEWTCFDFRLYHHFGVVLRLPEQNMPESALRSEF